MATSIRINIDTLMELKRVKLWMESEYVKPLSMDFVLKKIIDMGERKLIILE